MGLRDWMPGFRRNSTALTERRVEAVRAWLGSLNVADARELAEEELASGEVFQVVAKRISVADEHLLNGLYGGTRDFFSDFESVDAGSTALLRSAITAYAADSNYIEIGRDIETAMLAEIGTPRVLIVHDAVGMDGAETHESIWHYLLDVREWTKPKHVPA
jgi:hypothetical protein